MALGAVALFVILLLNDHMVLHQSWPAAVFGAVVSAALWIVVMGAIDRYRRRHGQSPLFPDGAYREELRRNWAVRRYRAAGWFGFAGGFTLIMALGVVVALTGIAVVGWMCVAVFLVPTIVCLVQAVRATRSPESASGQHSEL